MPDNRAQVYRLDDRFDQADTSRSDARIATISLARGKMSWQAHCRGGKAGRPEPVLEARSQRRPVRPATV
jgi:hypothetical protein